LRSRESIEHQETDVGAFLENFSRNYQLKMQKSNSKVQQILAGEVSMDTLTKFHVNGDVNIFPCGWVDEQVTKGGRHQSKGRMTIEEDGTSFFRAYRHNSGSRYEQLFETANGEVKRTRTSLIVKLVLPLGIGRIKMIEALTAQVHEMINYIKSLKERTIWK
jgi:hypothetical protein